MTVRDRDAGGGCVRIHDVERDRLSAGDGIKVGSVRRFALFLLVALLSASSGGIFDLLIPEPCSVAESGASAPEGTCPATCVRCHCARAFVAVRALEIVPTPHQHAQLALPLAPRLAAFPHDILHVPKRTRV